MTLIKLGELVDISASAVRPAEMVLSDARINERFQKFANTLRRIAPKADDFLYFSAVMLHAAEADLLNADGSPKLRKDGAKVEAHWEKRGNSWKWVCNEPSIKGYKNANGDMFPAEELLKAYKGWVGKPLCVDHKSASVDAIRGIILDTYYDHAHHRVIGLCALDKVSYPDLARKVATGYSCSVSMGTAVKCCSCYDCGATATCEAEFCQHMKNKTGYAEINVGLQPLELSLVVSGADPSAKIRTILAAAKDVLANSSSSLNSTGELSPEDQSSKLQAIKDDLKAANDKLAELQEQSEQPTIITEPYGQSSGRLNDPTDETDPNGTQLNLPQRLAHNEALLGELKTLQASLLAKMTRLEETHINNEGTMSDQTKMNKEGYWQGGGGVNEPAPGKVKYPKDPLNEQLREHEDKQMTGEKPFPDVGDVEGLHPSPTSVDIKDELQRKKMLARAERRQAALIKAKENIMNAKQAYWQGGGGLNEPAPHKVKYPIDQLEYHLREHEDKQMVGQKPFPDVGDVEGLHPSPGSAEPKDELQRKKLIQRAALKARFVKAANADGTENLGDSAWQVFTKDESGEKLILTASVNEITGGNVDALYDTVATKEFGSKMLGKIRSVGVSNAAKLYKKAQATTMPGTQSGMPADAGGPAPLPDMGAAPPPAPDTGPTPDDKGGDGDPKERALKLGEEARDAASDALEAIRELTGEKGEMGDLEQGLSELPKAASLRPLAKMRRQLNGQLLSGLKKSFAELKEVYQEMKLIASMTDGDTPIDKDYAGVVIDQALVDGKQALTDADGLLNAHAKYLEGVDGLRKKAASTGLKLRKVAADETEEDVNDADDVNDARKKKKDESKSKSKSDKKEKDNKKSSKKESEDCMDADDMFALDMNDHSADGDPMAGEDDDLGDLRGDEPGSMFDDEDDLGSDLSDEDLDMGPDSIPGATHSGDVGDALNSGELGSEHDLEDEDAMADDMNDVMMDVDIKPKNMPGAGVVSTASFDLSTKAGRTAYRTKLARDATGKQETGEMQDVKQHSDMIDLSNALADGQTHLDTKPSDSLGLVETLPEQQEKDLEVARAQPKVRKEAERLQTLISEGKVNPTDLDALIAEGLDPEVVKYWRQFWGEAGKEGSEFGKLLTTETLNTKVAEDQAAFRVKLTRAFELAHEMVKCGLCADNRSAVNAQVDEVMTWNDEAFESTKRIVAKSAFAGLNKQAGLPTVGHHDTFSDERVLRAQEPDLSDELAKAFSGRRY